MEGSCRNLLGCRVMVMNVDYYNKQQTADGTNGNRKIRYKIFYIYFLLIHTHTHTQKKKLKGKIKERSCIFMLLDLDEWVILDNDSTSWNTLKIISKYVSLYLRISSLPTNIICGFTTIISSLDYSLSMLKMNLLFIAFLTNSSLLMSPSPSSSTASLSM